MALSLILSYFYIVTDLRQELQVKDRCPDNDRLANCFTNIAIDSNRLKVEHETQTTPLKRKIHKKIHKWFERCGMRKLSE